MSVDWELLADHLGGALAGTPEHERVARLIATEPDWSRAADQLGQAFTTVTNELRGLPEPVMPPDVAARIDAALAAAPPPDGPPEQAPAAAAPGAMPSRTAPAPRRSGRPAGTRRPPSGPGRPGRPRRIGRWGTSVAVAASVVAAVTVGIGAWQVASQPLGGDDSGAAAPDTLAELPEAGTLAEPRLLATGADYRADPQWLAAPPPELDAGPQLESEQAPPGPAVATDTFGADLVPPALDRLWSDPQARTECLRLVVGEVAPAPASLQVIDFAHVDGEPAVVIWVTAGDLTDWVWVVGPRCGTPQAGIDEVLHVRIS